MGLENVVIWAVTFPFKVIYGVADKLVLAPLGVTKGRDKKKGVEKGVSGAPPQSEGNLSRTLPHEMEDGPQMGQGGCYVEGRKMNAREALMETKRRFEYRKEELKVIRRQEEQRYDTSGSHRQIKRARRKAKRSARREYRYGVKAAKQECRRNLAAIKRGDIPQSYIVVQPNSQPPSSSSPVSSFPTSPPSCPQYGEEGTYQMVGEANPHVSSATAPPMEEIPVALPEEVQSDREENPDQLTTSSNNNHSTNHESILPSTMELLNNAPLPPSAPMPSYSTTDQQPPPAPVEDDPPPSYSETMSTPTMEASSSRRAGPLEKPQPQPQLT
eukprot:Nk52_evm7s382 gene=Nk52_evmTU7s382